MDNLERLQKVMAKCNVASRRKCEELILQGRVMVNGEKVSTLGVKVKPKDIISVDGKEISKSELVYYLLHKPTGFITTTSDEHNRKTVLDLFNPSMLVGKRIFPVGRLDYDTSGALLITNDGEMMSRLIDSKNEVPKEYLARVDGIITVDNIITLTKGVIIDNVKTKRAKAELISVDKTNKSSLVKLVITEGKNRQVRKMFEVIGFKVKKLKRTSFANLSIEGLKIGEYRALKIHEVKQLYNLSIKNKKNE